MLLKITIVFEKTDKGVWVEYEGRKFLLCWDDAVSFLLMCLDKWINPENLVMEKEGRGRVDYRRMIRSRADDGLRENLVG